MTSKAQAKMDPEASLAYRRALVTGCLCTRQRDGGQGASDLMARFLSLLSSRSEIQEEESELLMLVSLLSAVVRTVLEDAAAAPGIILASEQGSSSTPPLRRRRRCGTLNSLARALFAGKWPLLALLRRVAVAQGTSSHLSSACRSLSVLLVRKLPCSSDDLCSRSCRPLARELVRGVSSQDGSSSAWSVEMVRAILRSEDDEDEEAAAEEDSGRKRRPGALPTLAEEQDCGGGGGVLRSELDLLQVHDASFHEKALRCYLLAEMRQEWRRWSACLGLRSDPAFLSLWESAVSVKSDFGYNASREGVACSKSLAQDVAACSGGEDLAWRKKLAILNEVLCYGSTLALQAEVSEEVSRHQVVI